MIIFLGIIDILQNYRLFKKLEHTWKSVLHDGVSIFSHSYLTIISAVTTKLCFISSRSKELLEALPSYDNSGKILMNNHRIRSQSTIQTSTLIDSSFSCKINCSRKLFVSLFHPSFLLLFSLYFFRLLLDSDYHNGS